MTTMHVDPPPVAGRATALPPPAPAPAPRCDGSCLALACVCGYVHHPALPAFLPLSRATRPPPTRTPPRPPGVFPQELARLIVKVLQLQDALHSAARSVPILRHTGFDHFATATTTTVTIGMI